jgi:hypothetical protein
MGRRYSSNGKRQQAETLYTDAVDTLEQLILENFELRQTAAELALQTAILRESLGEASWTSLYSGRADG